MEIATHIVLPVVETSQTISIRSAARDIAGRVGFDETDSYRVGLVATELATNLVKHARGGEVLIRATADNGTPGIELIALDRGPGMANIAASMVDGHSTTGTPGTGLGAVRRLSDEFDVYSSVPHGTAVCARLRQARSADTRHPPFIVGGVSVSKAGETECGDAWAVEQRQDDVMALVVDGLGHGPFAAAAADAVVQTIRTSRTDSCADALAAAHDGARHTRGAAAALFRISRSAQHLTFAGVGNISVAMLYNGATRQGVSQNGTLGHEVRNFREYQYPWASSALVVMHSDGLLSQWSLEPYPGIRNRHPAIIAAVLYRDFNRGRDDVTVLVGREAA